MPRPYNRYNEWRLDWSVFDDLRPQFLKLVPEHLYYVYTNGYLLPYGDWTGGIFNNTGAIYWRDWLKDNPQFDIYLW